MDLTHRGLKVQTWVTQHEPEKLLKAVESYFDGPAHQKAMPEPIVGIFDWYSSHNGILMHVQMLWGELLVATASHFNPDFTEEKGIWIGAMWKHARVSSCNVELVGCGLIGIIEPHFAELEKVSKQVARLFQIPWLSIEVYINGHAGLQVATVRPFEQTSLPFIEPYVWKVLARNYANVDPSLLDDSDFVMQPSNISCY